MLPDPLPLPAIRYQVYVMDVQLSAGVQRRGLGRFLMCLVELLGRRHGMAIMALTAMRANVAALVRPMMSLALFVGEARPLSRWAERRNTRLCCPS